MSILEWFGRIVDFIISTIPRFFILRPTHKAVKWPWGGKAVPLGSGIHWYWPLVTECELIVAARQTNPLPPQSIPVSGESYTVRGVAVFSIDDVVLAIGGNNWDVDSTVNDLCQAAIMDICAAQDVESIFDIQSLNKAITAEARELLKTYGINLETCRLLEIAQTKTHRIFGDTSYFPVEE